MVLGRTDTICKVRPHLAPPTEFTQSRDFCVVSKTATCGREHRRAIFSLHVRQQSLRQDVKGTVRPRRMINPPMFKIHITKGQHSVNKMYIRWKKPLRGSNPIENYKEHSQLHKSIKKKERKQGTVKTNTHRALCLWLAYPGDNI